MRDNRTPMACAKSADSHLCRRVFGRLMRAVVQRVSHADVRVEGDVRGRCGRGSSSSSVSRAETPTSRRSGWPGRSRACACSRTTTRALRPVAARRRGQRPGREPVHPDRGHCERESPELRRCGAAGGRRAAIRALLRRASCRGGAGGDRVFGARMELSLVNDGPVTIVLETRPACLIRIGRVAVVPSQARRQAVSSPLPRPTGLRGGAEPPWLGLERPHNGRLIRIKPQGAARGWRRGRRCYPGTTTFHRLGEMGAPGAHFC